MQKSTFKVPENASISLVSVLRRQSRKLRPSAAARAAGFRRADGAADDSEAVQKKDLVSLLVQADNKKTVTDLVPDNDGERVEPLGGDILSAIVSVDTAAELVRSGVRRVQGKKRSAPRLDTVLTEVGVRAPAGAARRVAETGEGVLIGVVDSGFDLDHPMFRDSNGALRVEGLLDQTDNNAEFDAAQLAAAWGPGGTRPGSDGNGHGTHVASIAGGTAFGGLEGVAPGARFLLVRTNFRDTADAVSWIFGKAGAKPCVVNYSLGHHWGAHDGTDLEEQLHGALTGQGKIIVVSAGNERTDRIHLGAWFAPSQAETVAFDVLRRPDGSEPNAVITLWHDPKDEFDITLITPSGQQIDFPALNSTDNYQDPTLEIELGRKLYAPSNQVQCQLSLAFRTANVPATLLRRWQLRLACRTAVFGRLDAWVNNSGFAEFHAHTLVEEERTVGLPATGAGCLAVASHLSKSAWASAAGDEQDSLAVRGRASPFSSLGPTRDGRWKPDLSSPGQYVTAALAAGSELAGLAQRANAAQKLLTIEGTSMAAPVVTGAVALLLQKKPRLTLDQARDALKASARHDGHTGPGEAPWNPAYGFGKLDVPAALARV